MTTLINAAFCESIAMLVMEFLHIGTDVEPFLFVLVKAFGFSKKIQVERFIKHWKKKANYSVKHDAVSGTTERLAYGKLNSFLDYPALIEHKTEKCSWAIDAKLHRAVGPARIFRGQGCYAAEQIYQFYSFGVLLKTKHIAKDGTVRMYKPCADPYMNQHNIEEFKSHVKSIYGILHNDDGPAEMLPNGTQKYCIEGKLHRIDGPAWIEPNGTEMYYINGKLHRIDGPAVILADGIRRYYVDNKLHRHDGPAVYSIHTNFAEYYLNGRLHRNDGPACIQADGTRKYYINGKLHRNGGPAIVRPNGIVEYYQDDEMTMQSVSFEEALRL